MSEMLTPIEVAEKLKVHPNTIRDYLKAGILPAIKLGRAWRKRQEGEGTHRQGRRYRSRRKELPSSHQGRI